MSTTAACANVPQLAVRTLACAVIKQALSDALDPTTRPDVRRDAEQFLAVMRGSSGGAWQPACAHPPDHRHAAYAVPPRLPEPTLERRCAPPVGLRWQALQAAHSTPSSTRLFAHRRHIGYTHGDACAADHPPPSARATATARAHARHPRRGHRIVSIDGDPENPATGGHVCLKGLAYARRVTSSDRLLRPLRRRTSGGGFEPVGWNDALDEIAERLTVPERCTAGGHALLRGVGVARRPRRARDGLLAPVSADAPPRFGDLCWPAGLEATRLTYATTATIIQR